MNEWRNDALCRGFPAEWWFPEQGVQFRSALFVCSRCPSRDPCLQFALDESITHGIWGGLTEAGRRKHKRKNMAGRNRPTQEQSRPAADTGAS